MIEQEQNHEDISDYNDFLKEEDLQSNEPDSFNKDIIKLYEDHKKSEVKPTNRPISSYQRVPSPIGSVGNNEAHSIQEAKMTYADLIKSLNNHLRKNRITQSKFCDNPTVFFLLSDFKDLFISLHFPISNTDLNTLFEEKNKSAKDGYINLTLFMKELTFYKLKDCPNNISMTSQSNQQDSCTTISHEYLEIRNLNSEFVQFNQDISNILREDKWAQMKGSNNNNQVTALGKQPQNRIQTAKQRQERSIIDSLNNSNITHTRNVPNQSTESLPNVHQRETINTNNSMNKTVSVQKKLPPKAKYDPHKIMKEMAKENQKEKEQIREDFYKRQREFLKNCSLKCMEATKMCSYLGSNMKYQIVDEEEDENEEKRNYKVEAINNDQKYEIMELKAFIVQWKIIQKAYLQKKNEKIYGLSGNNKKKKKEEVDQVTEKKNEKKERLDEIKKVLIDTVRLKIKLKNQLDNLQKTIKVDENIVIEHLTKAGIEIPGFYNTTTE